MKDKLTRHFNILNKFAETNKITGKFYFSSIDFYKIIFIEDKRIQSSEMDETEIFVYYNVCNNNSINKSSLYPSFKKEYRELEVLHNNLIILDTIFE